MQKIVKGPVITFIVLREVRDLPVYSFLARQRHTVLNVLLSRTNIDLLLVVSNLIM